MKKTQPQEPPALERRAQPGRIRAFVLAVVVHAAFFALIVFGVTWQSRPTPPVQAELWDKLPPAKAEPKAAAKAIDPPKPEPPKPEPLKPEPPKPEPPKPEPPKPTPAKSEPPKPDPEIALKAEREKKVREKLESEKREKEKRERLDRQKQDEAKKKREEDDAKKKREQEDVAKKKREDDKRRQEQESALREAERARAAVAQAKQSEIDSYVEKIKAKVRGRANVPDSVTGNPQVQVRIRILPGGDVLDIAITRSSGNPAYDSAIERAIRSAQPLPVPPANSELFPQFRDLNLQIRHER